MNAMPIDYAFKTKRISEDDFHALDYEVMALVFAIHNELGILDDER